jgi:hypothetical protein
MKEHKAPESVSEEGNRSSSRSIMLFHNTMKVGQC